MKRAYDIIKSDTDRYIDNKQQIHRLSQEKEQYEQQLIKDRQQTHKLKQEIAKYKVQINNMESKLTAIS